MADSVRIQFNIADVEHRELTNDDLYKIRKSIANCFYICGFGPIQEHQNDTFSTTYAIPVVDTYYFLEHLFVQTYRFAYPIANGDLNRLKDEEFPQLLNKFRREMNLDPFITIEFLYI